MANAVTDALESFSNSAMCTWMAGAAVQEAVPWVQGGLAITPSPYTKAAAVALTALQYGCSFNPGPEAPIAQEGCQGRAVPTAVQFYDPGYLNIPPGWVSFVDDINFVVDMSEVSSIVGITGQLEDTAQGVPVYHVIANYVLKDGSTVEVTNASFTYSPVTQLRMNDNGSACTKEPDPDPPGPEPSPVAPIDGFSPELNCNITATLTGFRLNSDGTASPVITYTTDQTTQRSTSSTVSTQNTQEIIQNCNWYGDLVYTGPSNCDCPVVTPLPPNPPDVPAPPEPGECPEPDPEPLPSDKYTMLAACNRGPNGELLEWEEQIAAVPGLEGIALRLKALNDQISQALVWKTPICPPERPELLGDWVTVRFESEEISPQGTRPLRKLFRYRSQSAYDLGQIAAYWENFQWNAGPVCVQHKDAWWGTPQCWAQNAEEGKRVIRFAGIEAGIDPDELGEWVISGSSDPRFGMPGTMRVAKVQGLEWVTSRQGPSGLPLLTVDP